jgi:hypothetical protein
MTDALTISIDGALAEDIRAAAEARGLAPEEYVRQQLAFDLQLEALHPDDDPSIDEAIAAEYDATGIGIPGDEVLAWLHSLGTDAPLPRPQARKLK